MHHYQTNFSILEHAVFGICVFCESTIFFTWGWCGNYVILYHANVFSVEDNIFGIEVVALTTLAAMRICFRDARHIL